MVSILLSRVSTSEISHRTATPVSPTGGTLQTIMCALNASVIPLTPTTSTRVIIKIPRITAPTLQRTIYVVVILPLRVPITISPVAKASVCYLHIPKIAKIEPNIRPYGRIIDQNTAENVRESRSVKRPSNGTKTLNSRSTTEAVLLPSTAPNSATIGAFAKRMNVL